MAGERGTALVTGAGRGIGRAIAVALVACGFDVVAASLESAEDAAPPADGARLHHVRFDLADIGSHAGLVEEAASTFGPLACLVNNAGVTSLERGDMLAVDAASFDRVMAVNLRGTFFLTQAVARHMLDSSPAGSIRYRSIVTITSANAEIVGEDRADYCMSKAALSMMSKLYAARLADHGVGVFEIRPGIIRTDMTAPAATRYDAFIEEGGVPMRRWGRPEDVARAVSVLARGELEFATGIHVDVGGGLQLHRI